VNETDGIIVLITTGSAEEAHNMAESLVKGKKAACVNIVLEVDSLFRWEGKLDSARESLLLVKTKASLFSEIAEMVKKCTVMKCLKSLPCLLLPAAKITSIGWTPFANRDVLASTSSKARGSR